MPSHTPRIPSDDFSSSDLEWTLCRATQTSYRDIWRIAAESKGNVNETVRRLIVGKTVFCSSDGGYWKLVCAWLRLYVNQWEQGFKKVTTELTSQALTPDEQNNLLEVAAKALNVAPEVLKHFAEHQAEIEQYLELQRHTLGTMAQVKLFELILSGDPATVRWYLARAMPEIYGDKKAEIAPKEVGPRKINIIEV